MAKPIAITDESDFLPHEAPRVSMRSAPAGPAPIAIDDEASFKEERTTPFAGVPLRHTAAPGMGETVLRGGAAGFLSDFSDEAAGGLRALAEGGDIRSLPGKYKVRRDEERQRNKDAEEANPLAYNASRIGGAVASAFVPATSLAKGAGVGAKLANAALMGGAAGLGASEEEGLAGQFKDTLGGALVGGATAGVLHGAGKLLSGAPKRLEDRAIAGLIEGAGKRNQARILGEMGTKREEVVGLLRSVPGLEKAALAKDTEAARDLVEGRLQALGHARDAVYDMTEKASPGMKVSDMLGKLEDIKDRLMKDPGKRDLARIVESKLNDVLESWGNRVHVPAREARALATDLGPSAFKSVPGVDPTKGEKIGREIYGTLVDMVDDHVTATARAAKLPVDGKALKALNAETARLIAIKDALVKKGTDEALSGPKRGVMQRGAEGMAALYGLATSNPLPWLATKVGPKAAGATDLALAKFMRAVQGPGSRAEKLAMAAQLGIPRATAEKAVEAWTSQ